MLALLARRFGVGTFDTYNTGDNVSTSTAGERSTYSDTGADRHRRRRTPRSSPTSRASSPQLDEMSKKVPVDAPWQAPTRSS